MKINIFFFILINLIGYTQVEEQEQQPNVPEEDKLLYKIREWQIDSEYYSVQTRLVTHRRIAFRNLEEYNLIFYNPSIDRYQLTWEGEEAYNVGYEKYVEQEEKKKELQELEERERRLVEVRYDYEKELKANRPWYSKLWGGIAWFFKEFTTQVIFGVILAVIAYLLFRFLGWN